MLERYIAEHISTRLPDFDMPAFCAQLREVCRRALPSNQTNQLTPASPLAPAAVRGAAYLPP